MKRFLHRLLKRPIAAISLLTLALLYGAMLFCQFLSPYAPTTVFEEKSYHPPNLSLYSRELGLGLQLQKRALVDPLNWRYVRLKGQYLPVRLFVLGQEYRLFGAIPMRLHLFGTTEPYGTVRSDVGYPVFLFGADHLGRDLFTRTLYGSRISLTIGFIAITISLTIAILLGGIAGYSGGIVDWVIMRITEFFILIPGLYLILFLRSILLHEADSGLSFFIITIILSLVGWTGSARLIRGLVHSIKREDYISVARLQGIPAVVIIFRQIIPQMSSILIISITLGIPGFILSETALSYIGLGITDPAVSWGSLLNRNLTSFGNLRSFPWLLYPGLMLVLTTLSYSFLGDLLRDILDPYWRESQ